MALAKIYKSLLDGDQYFNPDSIFPKFQLYHLTLLKLVIKFFPLVRIS